MSEYIEREAFLAEQRHFYCDNCEIRKNVARMFDLHWLGEDDCPFTCPYTQAEEGE